MANRHGTRSHRRSYSLLVVGAVAALVYVTCMWLLIVL